MSITGPSKALIRCQVLGETNSGGKLLEDGHDRLRRTLEPNRCSSNRVHRCGKNLQRIEDHPNSNTSADASPTSI